MSTCKSVAEHTDVSLDMCKYLACDNSANTINYRTRNCSLHNCPPGNPKVKPVTTGWKILQLSGNKLHSGHTSDYFKQSYSQSENNQISQFFTWADWPCIIF